MSETIQLCCWVEGHGTLTPLEQDWSCPDCGSREQVWARHLDGTHDRYCSPCFWRAFRMFRYQP